MLLILKTPKEHLKTLTDALVVDPNKHESHKLDFGEGLLFFNNDEREVKLNLLINSNPFDLIRYRKTVPGLKQAQKPYISTRPYTATMFMSLFIARALRTPLAGMMPASKKAIPLTIDIPVLPCPFGQRSLEELFEPLGYSVSVQPIPFDALHPDWGDAPYCRLSLTHTLGLTECLKHLYTLLAVLDVNKDEWVQGDKINDLRSHISDWLPKHEHLEKILHYYDLSAASLKADQTQDNQAPDTHTSSEVYNLEEALLQYRIFNHSLLRIVHSFNQDDHFQFIKTALLGDVPVKNRDFSETLELLIKIQPNLRTLIYHPPTMSFPYTSDKEDYLEHPESVFAYYRDHHIDQVVCEEKHMGARATITLCETADFAKKRFELPDGMLGFRLDRISHNTPLFTKGMRFFDDIERDFINHLHQVLTDTNIWKQLKTQWLCLDAEIMPWTPTNRQLKPVRHNSFALYSTGYKHYEAAKTILSQLNIDGFDSQNLVHEIDDKIKQLDVYRDVYHRYCWPVKSYKDIKLAPFHVMASEGQVHTRQDHVWHLSLIEQIAKADSLSIVVPTHYKVVDVNDKDSIHACIQWWHDIIAKGSEGCIIKPLKFIDFKDDNLVQPAIKCRAKDYLKVVYGPEYHREENLKDLRERLTATKERMAFHEFSIGLEGLERFVRGEPIEQVFECFLGVLALECGYK